MSHELTFVNGEASLAFNGDVPWHGLGTDVSGKQLTPAQMGKVSKTDFEVEKVPAYSKINQFVNNQAEIDEIVAYNEKIAKHNAAQTVAKKKKKLKEVPEYKEGWELRNVKLKAEALVRKTDGYVLDEVTEDWQPVQNAEAFEFFNEFVAAGDMEMETVGSLKNGQIVWCLAKLRESFELFKGDQTDSHLLFTNFHKYGHSTTVMFTPVRVVCNNTLTMALGSKIDELFKFSHRRKFNPEAAKEVIGVSKEKLAWYKEKAAFLGSKKAKNEDIVEYLKRLMPGSSKTSDKSKKIIKPEDALAANARFAYDIIPCQPGHEYAEGSWWQPFNAVTFFLDHEICKTQDQRLKMAWYGTTRTLKMKALDLALEYAGK